MIFCKKIYRLFDEFNVEIESEIPHFIKYLSDELVCEELPRGSNIDYYFKCILKKFNQENIDNYIFYEQPKSTYINKNKFIIVIYSINDYCSFLSSFFEWLTIIASKHNIICLHGSSVLYKDKAILLFGLSGSGKTTLVKTLINEYNCKFIADDLLFTKKINNNYIIYNLLNGINIKSDTYKTYNYFRNDNKIRVIIGNKNDFQYYIPWKVICCTLDMTASISIEPILSKSIITSIVSKWPSSFEVENLNHLYYSLYNEIMEKNNPVMLTASESPEKTGLLVSKYLDNCIE